MIENDLWWPDETKEGIAIVPGSNQHNKVEYGRTVGRTTDHLYTMKQTKEKIIWACACGRTLSKFKKMETV